jgi:hypothetical protein
MTMTLDPSNRMRRQAKLMNAGNVVMRRLLSLPFPTPLSARLMLLTVTGRRTGKVYRQPISYVRNGETLLTPGGGRWKLNLEPGRPVSLRIRGKDQPATPTIISDLDEVERLLTVIVAGNPAAGKFMPISIDDNGHVNVEQLKRAVSYGFCIISWQLVDPPQGRSPSRP